MRIRKIHKSAESWFLSLLGKKDLSLDYIQKGNNFGLFEDDELLGGYCLVHEPLYQMYIIQQIPKCEHQFDDEDPFNYVEVVCYFTCNDEKYAARLRRHFVTRLLLHKASYIVYSYPSSDTRIEEYCQVGNPLRLYSGEVKNGGDPVNVEVMTKLGILKICMHKVIRSLVNIIKWF
jgi:hypothetical protein